MPSDLINSEQFVNENQLITRHIEVARINNSTSIGSRMWFVLQDTQGIVYQKWSLLMNETDAILALVQVGDKLEISYWIEEVSDPVFRRTTDFVRNNITTACYIT